MSRSARLTLFASAALLAAVLLVVAGYVFDRATHSGEVARGVHVGPTDIGGMTVEEATEALNGLEDDLAADTLSVVVDGTEFPLDPLTIGFDIDEPAAIEEAMTFGRQGGTIGQFRWWLRNAFSEHHVAIPASIQTADLEVLLNTFEQDALDAPPFEGAIEIEDDRPVARYPSPGRGINTHTAAPRIAAALVEIPRPSVTLDVVEVPPVMRVSDVDLALADARLLLAGPIELTRTDPDATVELSVPVLADALVTSTVLAPIPGIDVGFDPDVIGRALAPVRAQFEAPPKDAELQIDDEDNVILVEGRPGALIDPVLAAQAAEEAARFGTRTAELPFEDGALPEVTTEELATLGIIEKVSEFTTFHPCCQARVTNIHLFADIIDGTLVMPGESFSLNEAVGRRTEAAGFLPAPTIIGGKLEDTVGGGVSQFATTFYNAVFYGGYEDVTHRAHSYYFPRYPEGIEATISWPAPDLEFRNDTDAAVLIIAEYTNESITVKFFGNNGGRQVEGIVSDRFGWTEPPIEYIPIPEFDPTVIEGDTIEEGARGWSVTVTRIITFADGTTEDDTWTVRYRAQPTEIEIHPCNIPEGADGHTGEECPVDESSTSTTEPGDGSTTTTEPDDTTTTTSP